MKKNLNLVFLLMQQHRKKLIVMRNTVLILLLSALQVFATGSYAQTKKISLAMKDATIKEVLFAIEKQSEFYFLFNSELINVTEKVNISIEEEKVENVLTQLFNKNEVEFLIKDRYIVLTPALGREHLTTLQQRTVSGKVTDFGGQPLPGVTVVVKGTTQGTVTNAEGEYSMGNIPEDATLVFSFVGMRTQEIPLEGRTTLTVVMEEETIGLDEVVAVGYGTMSREMITTSVSKMDGNVLRDVPYANAASALQGTLPGVRVQNLSGQPGSAPRIIVRGGTSINNPNGASPLYVVDGVIRPHMNNIPSDDIESIQILKDAASTAIYGARGSNGVVLVTTKKGKVGKVEVSYSYDLFFSQPGKLYDLANARDYLKFGRRAMVVNEIYPDASFRLTNPTGFGTGNDLTKNTAYTTQYLSPENEHKLNEGWESMPDPLDPSKTLIFKDTDWQDVLFRTGVSHNHHFGVNGGSQNAKFSASLGYLDNQGIAITTDMKRYTLNLTGDITVNEKLSFFGKTSYVKSVDHQVPSISNIFARAMTLPPTTKYTFEDGTLAPGQALSEGNPEYVLTKTRESENSQENLTFTLGGKWNILQNLSFEPTLSLYNIYNNSYYFNPAYLNGPNNWVDSRNAGYTNYRWRQTQFDGIFTYFKSVSKHNFDATLGFSYYDRRESRAEATGRYAATDNIPTLNASAEAVNVSSSITDHIIAGVVGRLNYNYDNTYLFTFNMRYDGASNLGENYKWGFFPGISVGWNMHNEDFWQSMSEKISRFKLRGSYGVNGNISGLGDYTAQGSYSVGKKYAGLSAIQNTVIPNTELKWERSKTIDLGADIGLFNNRINLLFDVYRRVTDNLITSYALPPSTGFGSILTNLGSLENKGVELELNFDILQKSSSFQWNLGFNSALVANKILKLPENGVENNRIGGYYVWDPSINDYNWLGGLQEGGRLGDYYEYKGIGIYATDEEAANAPYDEIARVKDVKLGGDVIWADIDDNGIIDSRDKVYLGNEHPKWTGGLSNTFSYKNLMLYVRMDYTTGHTIYNYARAFMNGQWKLNMNLTQEMVDHAWEEQGDNTYLPRYDWESARASYNIFPTRTGQEYYEKGDFLAIREITLSYDIPKSVIDFVNIESLRLNVTGNNLHYFTKYKGLNPEYGGRDYGRYPVPRNIIFGVNVIF
ncbi:TonB-dependent receptor [Mariniphaga sediminis]|nr:TonB-dependent receptor [Mariniphaga sediminis]